MIDPNDKHPCFNRAAAGHYARIHLPVAPECNIQCKYCSRKYDCVNESRPGVTSAVLTPEEACDYLRRVRETAPHLAVVGIAGPGDPFANPAETLKTLELVHAAFPDLVFCLSTNGLNLYDHIDRLVELGVSHVTVTVNAVDPAVGADIYSWVRFKKRIYRGVEGAEVLLREQLRSIARLKECGLTVKINSIIVPGVNDTHIPAVAAKMKELGADLVNCVPLLLADGSEFAQNGQAAPNAEMIAGVRKQVAAYLPVMEHCQRCRADAAGLLGQDDPAMREQLRLTVENRTWIRPDRPYVAAATYEGLLVNRHLGETDCFCIFSKKDDKFVSLEKRLAPPPGSGDDRWRQLAWTLRDCSVLLVADLGDRPFELLTAAGLKVVRCSGLIDGLLRDLYDGRPLKTVSRSELAPCRRSCGGGAAGGCCS